MKKMIPVYALQLALLATIIVGGYRLTQHLALVESELAGIRREQVKQPLPGARPARGAVLQVEVINTPSVNVLGSIDCNVMGTVAVNVENEPVEVEIVR